MTGARPAAAADYDASHWADALLRCPQSGEPLVRDGDAMTASMSGRRYRITPTGIPLFAEHFCSDAARVQQAHYENIAQLYTTNLGYPHTQVYMHYLDEVLLDAIAP